VYAVKRITKWPGGVSGAPARKRPAQTKHAYHRPGRRHIRRSGSKAPNRADATARQTAWGSGRDHAQGSWRRTAPGANPRHWS
jgi:hypothetical protein